MVSAAGLVDLGWVNDEKLWSHKSKYLLDSNRAPLVYRDKVGFQEITSRDSPRINTSRLLDDILNSTLFLGVNLKTSRLAHPISGILGEKHSVRTMQ